VNRLALWAAVLAVTGLGLGALLGGSTSGDVSSGDDGTWAMPEESQVPRHDSAAFAEAFAALHWPQESSSGGDAPAGGLSGWRLLGIVSTGDTRHALLLPASGGRALRVAEGGALPGGITLDRLEGSRITLRDSQRCTLTLGMPARQDAQVRCPP
jgi:hypothetical protein